MATTYYGDKIRYNGTLIQSGGGSSYPIISLGTRLGDNGFKVSGSSGFIRKVETSTITTGGYTTVWKTTNPGDIIYSGGGIRADRFNRSYKITMSAKATYGKPSFGATFEGWYDSCTNYYSHKVPNEDFSTTPKTIIITDSYEDQDAYWSIKLMSTGAASAGGKGTLDIYYLNITIFYGYNQTGASAVLCNYGSPYVAPTNQTITNTYYV